MIPAVVQVPVSYRGLLYEPHRYPDVKDPCAVFDGVRWHVFGTGCGLPDGAEILHVTAPTFCGPWREEPPPALHGADASATVARQVWWPRKAGSTSSSSTSSTCWAVTSSTWSPTTAG